MRYIGFSLGGCLRSIAAKEVDEQDVMFIVTRTKCPTFETYMQVVNDYYTNGNILSSNHSRYKFTGCSLEEVTDLAHKLWNAGKIHQPRNYTDTPMPFHMYEGAELGLWMQVVPTNQNTNPIVVDAYEKYKILDNLTR